MIELPVVDASAYYAALKTGRCRSESQSLGAQIKEACHSAGMFYLVGYNIDKELIASVMETTAQFFASDESAKQAISIKQSSNFRGYGLLKNYRDWREQIHIGMESSVPDDVDSALNYWRLWGDNQWPNQAFKDTVLSYFAACDSLSRTLLTLLAESLELPGDFFTARMKERPYLLMKAMSYLPQQAAEMQMGVTAHCDWSWLTFLLQDDVGGLEAQDLSGIWRKVNPLPDSIVVNTGELLEIETGGYLRASPHRVINSRIDRQRFSVPVFINPALDAPIYPADTIAEVSDSETKSSDLKHVHKVIKPGTTLDTFIFGDSEFDRKARGLWCYSQECVTAL